MKIAKNTVVAFDYTLTDKDGKTLDSSRGRAPLEYLHGAGNIIPGLERELEGLCAGDAKRVEVAPEDGYGVPDPALVIEVPRSAVAFAGPVEPGGVHAFSVVGVTEEKIRLDGNHPLAGVTLFFDVEIRSVRAAEESETRAGRPGADSCGCGGDCGGDCSCGGNCGGCGND